MSADRKRKLSQNTSRDSKRKKLKRENETPERRSQILAAQVIRTASYRAKETEQERVKRLNLDSQRKAAARANRGEYEKSMELAMDDARHF